MKALNRAATAVGYAVIGGLLYLAAEVGVHAIRNRIG